MTYEGVCLGLAVLAAALASAARMRATHSFGDSLSDVGNALIASTIARDPVPLPAFDFEGQFSNGLNWVDDLTPKLGLSVSPSLTIPPGNDFAFGGAQTGQTIANPPVLGGRVAHCLYRPGRVL